MAELPPPSLLLDRRERGWPGAGGEGLAPLAVGDQRPDPATGAEPRPVAVRTSRAQAGDDGDGPRGVPLRGADLRPRPRDARRRPRAPGRSPAAPRRRHLRRRAEAAGAAAAGACLPADPAARARLSRGAVRTLARQPR